MIEKRKSFIINVVYFGIIVFIGFVALKFSFKYLTPFIFGFLIAFILKPVVERLVKVFGDRKYVSLIVILLFYSVVGMALLWIVLKSVNTIGSLAVTVPEFYTQTVHPMVVSFLAWVEEIIETLDPSLSEQITPLLDGLIKNITSFLPSFVASFASKLTSTLTSVPSMLISVLIAIISSFFFATDYRNIVNGILNLVPRRQRQLILDIKDGVLIVLIKYLRAYGILMSVTFVELSVAFLVLGVSNPFGLAALTASVDILPVLGTGSVMIPWAIIELTVGNQQLGLGLALVYIAITIVRNVLEPRVVGKQIGLHPVLTLVCIYVGLRLFGFIGLLGLPITATLIKTLYEEGKLNFKDMDDSPELPDLKLDDEAVNVEEPLDLDVSVEEESSESES